MASAKANADKVVGKAPAELDIKKIMGAFGLDESDFESVGGLRSIIPAEVQHANGTTVIGLVVALLDMPERKSIRDPEKKEPWQALLVKLAAPTLAKQGEEVNMVEAGESVLIPVNGALRNNPDLLNAAIDPEQAYACILKVRGQLDTGKPTEMWDYDVKMALKKPVARASDPELAIYGRSFGTRINAIVAGQAPKAMAQQATAGANSAPATA